MNASMQYKISSLIGPLHLVASEKGLQGIYFKSQPTKTITALKGDLPAVKILDEAASQLEAYFAGRRQGFDVPLDLAGTPFQRKVWQALAKIPFGQTCSYGDEGWMRRTEGWIRRPHAAPTSERWLSPSTSLRPSPSGAAGITF